ncbi:WAT1-related protein At1g09380-like isoform X2 [Mangifera indica]|uniref:WAT1-related protein At1g09380-like isoform X2 n=1 Tax=Mangifera indica TaxID=29780 RepID=UPI001CFC0933|nr:WAT1-related protein At1g09380-like isoform X2 [Mangifera indica]
MLSDFLPFLFMVSVQFGYAGMDITAKLALEAGMKPLVLVTYRQIFATFVMLPVAYFLEWKTRPKITKFIVFQILLCSLTGATGNQVLYFVGLAYSTPTIGCALTNILPAVTFVLAVVFRQEFVGIKTRAGQAKVLGTVLCVGGAMLLSFYNGEMIPIPNSGIHWGYANRMSTQNASTNSNLVLGSILLMASTVSWAAWIVIQTQMSKKFPAPYISTTLMCFLGSIECGLTGLISEHKLSAWSLSSPIRLISAIYAPHILEHSKERPSLCLRLQPTAPHYRRHSQLGPAWRETISGNSDWFSFDCHWAVCCAVGKGQGDQAGQTHQRSRSKDEKSE